MRIAKINTIVKCPVNKLFAVENTYYGNNKTDRQVITNNKLPLRLTLIKCHISKLSQLRKFNCWKINICRSQYRFWYPWYQKAKIALQISLRNKRKINYHFKGLYKTTCDKKRFNFSQFFFSHWLLYECFFPFLIKTLVNFEKLIRFYQQKRRKFENTDRNILPKTYSF